MTPTVVSPAEGLVLRGRAVALPPGPPGQAARTLAEHVAPFLGWLRTVRGRSVQTIDQYGRDLRQFIPFCSAVGVRMPAQVDFRLIEAYLGWLQSPERGLKAASASQHFHAIRGFCLYLTREGFMPRNAAAEAFGPKSTKPLPRGYLSPDEQEHVLAVLSAERTLLGRRDYALIAFALMTGVRCNEIATLPLAHVHLDGGRVLIHGKGSKDREVPLVPRLVAILRPYAAEVRPALLGPGRESAFFFVRAGRQSYGVKERRTGPAGWDNARKGLPLERRSVWYLIQHRLRPLVGRHVNPHALRHSFATRIRTQGGDLQFLQELLGHADIRTTTVYSHIVTMKQRDHLAGLLAETLRSPADRGHRGGRTGGPARAETLTPERRREIAATAARARWARRHAQQQPEED